MKKYKNIYWSLVFYALTIVFVVIIPALLWFSSPEFASAPSFLGHSLLAIGILSIFIGIFFGFRSIKAKESSWTGHLMLLIGGLMLAYPIIVSIIGYSL
jgi:hypothetical protein